MLHVLVRTLRVIWLLVLLCASFIPLAARPTSAQAPVSCGAACTFLPMVNDSQKVYIESVALRCAGADYCTSFAGTIRNGLDVPIADVSFTVLPPPGSGGTRVPTRAYVMYRGLAPGASVRFIAALDPPQPQFADPITRLAVDHYTVNPAPAIRQLTLVAYQWEPGTPNAGTLKVTLRNDTRDRVGQIRVLIATDPDGENWEAFEVNVRGRFDTYPIPALAPGQSTVIELATSPRTPILSAYFPFGAEGVVVP